MSSHSTRPHLKFEPIVPLRTVSGDDEEPCDFGDYEQLKKLQQIHFNEDVVVCTFRSDQSPETVGKTIGRMLQGHPKYGWCNPQTTNVTQSRRTTTGGYSPSLKQVD